MGYIDRHTWNITYKYSFVVDVALLHFIASMELSDRWVSLNSMKVFKV